MNGSKKVLHTFFFFAADINECEEFGICPQSCRNSKGSYECFCVDGFKSMSSHYGERCAADGMTGSLPRDINPEECDVAGNELPLLIVSATF